jgi:hypothetical protein
MLHMASALVGSCQHDIQIYDSKKDGFLKTAERLQASKEYLQHRVNSSFLYQAYILLRSLGLRL